MSNMNTLLSQALSQEQPQPEIFQQISIKINESPQQAQAFYQILNKHLSSQRNPKQQYIILDLIEFTTCRCKMFLHQLYNEKQFLKLINALFNQNNLTLLIKEKNLKLIVFWKNFFKNKEDIFPNFNWYYQNILKRNIELPPFEPSPYQIYQKQKSQEQPGNSEISKEPFYQPNTKQAKLLQDLNVVKENITVGNELIDNKEIQIAFEIVKTLRKMEKKLLQLPDILNKEKEDYLYRLTLALMQDIEITKQRFRQLKTNQKVQPFQMASNQIQKKQEQIFQKVESSSNIYKPQIESQISQDIPLPQNKQEEIDLLGFEIDQPQITKQIEQDEIFKDFSTQNLQNSKTSNTQFQNTQNSNEFQFDNFDNFEPLSQNSQKNIQNQNLKKRQSNDLDIDLLDLGDLKVSEETPQQKKEPKDLITFNKPLQDTLKKEKIEYDPFPDIDLLNQFNINNMENNLFSNKFLQNIFRNYQLKVDPVKKSYLTIALGILLLTLGMISFSFMRNISEFKIKYNQMFFNKMQ